MGSLVYPSQCSFRPGGVSLAGNAFMILEKSGAAIELRSFFGGAGRFPNEIRQQPPGIWAKKKQETVVDFLLDSAANARPVWITGIYSTALIGKYR